MVNSDTGKQQGLDTKSESWRRLCRDQVGKQRPTEAVAEPGPRGQHAAVLRHISPHRVGMHHLCDPDTREPSLVHCLLAECPSWNFSLATYKLEVITGRYLLLEFCRTA